MTAPTDLTVDTSLLKSAADRLEDAAASLVGVAVDPGPCPLPVDALGPDPIGREVIDAAERSVRRSAESAALLAERLTAFAAAVRMAATRFRAADQRLIRPPR